MLAHSPHRAFEALRAEIAKIEAGGRVDKGVLAFGIPELDCRLPGGGLPLGALHEVAGGGTGAVDGAASALFAASLAARTQGPRLWCIPRPDLFAPALFQAGLAPERVIYLEAGDDKTLLACCEEGLRHGGLGAVVGEVSRLSSPASRRLQLAAESASTLGVVVRRWSREQDAADFGQPTASTPRWRGSPPSSYPLPPPLRDSPRRPPPAGGSPPPPHAPCRRQASAGPDGLSSSSAAGRASAWSLNWKPLMRRVVSLYLPTWPTDRLRRRLGKDAPPAEAPVVLIGRSGSKRLVLAANDPAKGLGIYPGAAAARAQAIAADLTIQDADLDGDLADLQK